MLPTKQRPLSHLRRRRRGSSRKLWPTNPAVPSWPCCRRPRKWAKEDCARAMDLAHKISFQLRASEERGRELEAEVAHFRDRATRAEAWLLRIHNEVEQTFFSKQEREPRQAPRP